jgi:hypothetical protein
MAVTFAASSGSSAAAPSAGGSVRPGQGLAIAQTDRIDPRAGGLSIGFTFGTSIAGHQNTVAQASSRAIDLGIIGTTLAAPGCDGGNPTLPADKQPQALQVDSRDPNAAQGEDQDESAIPVPIHKRVLATPAPFGEAITTTAGFGIPGVMEIGPGVSHSYSGLIEDGATREAKAVTDIASIDLAGAVHLAGLHWEAVWRSTGGGPQAGTFTIGTATIGGNAVPTQDPMAVITQANQLLNTLQLGVQIAPPTARQTNGVQFVDPMGLQVVPSHQRDMAASTLLGGAQPVRQQIVDAMLAANCQAASPVTISDIVVGSFTGAGSFNMILGGVQASSGEIAENPFHLGTLQLGASASLNGAPAAASRLGGATARPSTAPGAGAAAGAAPPPAAKPIAPIAALASKGVRGGAMAGVGLASLGALAVLAAADQRKMRRAQRDIPQFTV